jgi:asparagine synthetase B (glutamine-hydrolysing)
MSANAYPHLFAATAAKSGRISLSPQTLSRLYHRYGKGFYKHLPRPAAFALYDSRRATLYLGGTGGEKCYLEAVGGVILFSSDAHLLRAPTAVDLFAFKD